MAQQPPLWRIQADTGGTFTDAVALGPDGSERCVKILSTGALRGVIARTLSATRFQVSQRWMVAGGGLAGCWFRLLDERGSGIGCGVLGVDGGAGAGALNSVEAGPILVREFDPDACLIDLDRSPDGCWEGSRFEVFSGEEAPVMAARLLTGTPVGSALPPIAMRLATTRGTNALLTRRGARVAFFVTRGFGDLLEIGTQQRPDLFALEVRKPAPLYDEVVEVDERVDARGLVLRPLSFDGLAGMCGRLLGTGVRSAAVALLHADRFPDHELRLRERLLALGFEHVSISSEASPFIKIVPRATTAVADAYLGPVVKRFVTGVQDGLSAGKRVGDGEASGGLSCLTSAGGLVHHAAFNGKDSLLSGPAAGVVGALLAAKRSGFSRVISFDMGGTSTDVARLDGEIEYCFEHGVGDTTLAAPAVAIHTVAAGGGSICRIGAGGALAVGPGSAGATPGPACYGAGGPLTLTDVNLLLERLDDSRFGLPLDRGAAESALAALVTSRGAAGLSHSNDDLLAAFLEIANERMAGAIARVSTRAGYDPGEYALLAFGGAGGQHACAVAERLGITRVIVPQDAGVLSALGLRAARVERFAQRQVLRPLREVMGGLGVMVRGLEEEAVRGVLNDPAGEGVAIGKANGTPAPLVRIKRRLAAMRLSGQESTLDIDLIPGADPMALFAERYGAVNGHPPSPEGREIELVWVRVIACDADEVDGARGADAAEEYSPERCGTARAYFAGSRAEAPVFDRDNLRPGARLEGPGVVYEAHGATVVEPGWRLRIDSAGALVLSRPEKTGPAVARAGAGRTEVLTSRLESIAREMGAMLERTAVSTNVKERLDFSCAVLDQDAELIACAPHVPVHLGSLGCCVRAVRDAISIGPGDHIVTNHPAFGGSHLPDVTVVSAVFGRGGRPIAYVASRAHHAEIGGIRPGSMPPMARTLAEEGVVIPPMHLVRNGVANYAAVAGILSAGVFPSRAVPDNLADLRAAVAANVRGVTAIADLSRTLGEAALRECFDSIKRTSADAVAAWARGCAPGVYEGAEYLDDGSPIRVRITIAQDQCMIDLSGSAPTHQGNLNATPAIVRSVIVYVLRLLVREDVPLNEGLLAPVCIIVPEGIFNPPFTADPAACPAVVGGNVETSQRLVDTLLRALGAAACSQGTMNNLVFGDSRISYYETVCGGVGAGPRAGGGGFAGASAVHSHMTNTRITDPEILETRYPVRLERFAVRRGSGGAGAFRGGDGVIRELVFLEPTSVSVLTQHRREGPYGLGGGSPGEPGRQRIVRASGEVIVLGSIDQCEAGSGDRLILETPGGGGYGGPGGAGAALR